MIQKIFNELLSEWERDELCIWQDRSVDMESDYQNILDRKEDFKKRFKEALSN